MKWARSSEARKTQTLGPELSPWIFYSAAQKHHYAYHNGNIFHINPFHCFFLGCKLTCTCLSHTQTHTKRSHQKANTPKKKHVQAPSWFTQEWWSCWAHLLRYLPSMIRGLSCSFLHQGPIHLLLCSQQFWIAVVSLTSKKSLWIYAGWTDANQSAVLLMFAPWIDT